LITVLDVYQSAKNQMGAHKLWVLQFVASRGIYFRALNVRSNSCSRILMTYSPKLTGNSFIPFSKQNFPRLKAGDKPFSIFARSAIPTYASA
jgi:hypothetical protein